MLGDVVGAGARRRDEACHRGGVDDVAGVLSDAAGREGAHAMNHSPQIDAEDPLPVADAVLPYRAERRHAGVVAHEEGISDAITEGAHFRFLGNIDSHRKAFYLRSSFT